MFFSEDAILNAAVFAALGVLIVIQVMTSLLRGKTAGKVLSYVNPALHIATVFLLLFANAPLEKAVMVFMLSLLSLVICESVLYSISLKRPAPAGSGTDVSDSPVSDVSDDPKTADGAEGSVRAADAKDAPGKAAPDAEAEATGVSDTGTKENNAAGADGNVTDGGREETSGI